MGSESGVVAASDIEVNVWTDVDDHDRPFVDVQVGVDVLIRLCNEPADGRPVVELVPDVGERPIWRVGLGDFEEVLVKAKHRLLGDGVG